MDHAGDDPMDLPPLLASSPNVPQILEAGALEEDTLSREVGYAGSRRTCLKARCLMVTILSVSAATVVLVIGAAGRQNREAPAPLELDAASGSGTGGCNGSGHQLHTKGDHCFCFYTGSCLEEFRCFQDESLDVCQRRVCGESPLEVTSSAVSFSNVHDHSDVLTIPVPYYRDILSLSLSCDGAQDLLTTLLRAGRRVFRETGAGGFDRPAPQYQCIHLLAHVSVHWLHVHTFIGTADDSLPNKPPLAVCVGADILAYEAAARLLSMVSVANMTTTAIPDVPLSG